MPASEPIPPTPSPGLRLVELDPAADPRWDAYVEGHRDGSVFHHSAWLRTLSREYGQPTLGLAAEDGSAALHGVLPLMATRGLPGGRIAGVAGRRLASLPRTPVAGPIADEAATLALLVRGAVDRTPAGAQLQIKMASPALDGVPGVTGHPWRVSYVLDLPASGDVRFGNSRNHSRIRWAVNKARKEGVTVRDGAAGDVGRWHPLYLDVMRHHMVPPRPRRFFDLVWEELAPRGMVRLVLAEREGELLAGAILVMLGSTVFYLFNGVRRDAFSLRPNDVIQWEAIHACAAAGYRHYDFGEVVEHHEGLADFKRKWGTEARRLHRYYHPAPDAAPDPGDGEQGRVATLGARAWQRVPLPLTATIGDRLFRYL